MDVRRSTVNTTFHFKSSWELTCDAKNRMPIPAEVRRQLDPERDGEAFILRIGTNRKLWLFPERYYEQQYLTRESLDDTASEDELALQYMRYAMIWRLPIDAQGRILIPEKVMKQTGLGREVALLGMLHRLEIWDRAEWDVTQKQIIERSGQINDRVRAARAGGLPSPTA
jgi:MraZ protein